MAKKAFKELDDHEQLNCSICLDIYTDPRLLQCFHTYCTKCLIKLVVRDRQGYPAQPVVRSHPFHPMESEVSSQLFKSGMT